MEMVIDIMSVWPSVLVSLVLLAVTLLTFYVVFVSTEILYLLYFGIIDTAFALSLTLESYEHK